MLQNKYLSIYQFAEKHSITLRQPPEVVWPFIARMDFSGVWVIRILFALRMMPAKMMNLEGLQRGRFVILEQKENEELIIGLIGQFWRPSGNLQKFLPEEFSAYSASGFVKATWNFLLVPKADQTVEVITETRIWCPNSKVLKKFSRYWFFVRPFSGLIRREILKQLKRKAEATQR
jgi:hypothetical protein